MKIIENGAYTYVPTREVEVSQKKRVYKAYFLGEFVGYRVKVATKQLTKGIEKKVGFGFKPCKKRVSRRKRKYEIYSLLVNKF